MTESRAWRLTIVGCVTAICLTAIVCCWLLRSTDARYVHATGSTVLDKQTGDLIAPKTGVRYRAQDAVSARESGNITDEINRRVLQSQ